MSNGIWRFRNNTERIYPGCSPQPLSGSETGSLLLFQDEASFTNFSGWYYPLCYKNATPVASSSEYLGVMQLDSIINSWEQYSTGPMGGFRYSIYPTIYSLTSATVIATILTLTMYASERPRPGLQKISSAVGSVNLLALLGYSITLLSDQQNQGYESEDYLLDALRTHKVFLAIDFINVLLLQLAQVQIVMRLFPREREKRVIFWIGGVLAIASQVIWGVAHFPRSEDDDLVSQLTAFIYLLRIAMGILYAVLVILYAVTKIIFIFQTEMIIITIFTFISTNLSVAFFILDICNAWAAEISDIFNSCTYIISVVVVWEWINRIEHLERQKEKAGVLGRPFFEDELELVPMGRNKKAHIIVDSLSMFGRNTSDPDDSDNNNSHDNYYDHGRDNRSPPNVHVHVIRKDSLSFLPGDPQSTTDPNNARHQSRIIATQSHTSEKQKGDAESKSASGKAKPFGKFKSSLNTVTLALAHFTDQLIDIGLSIPRVTSSALTVRNIKESILPIKEQSVTASHPLGDSQNATTSNNNNVPASTSHSTDINEQITNRVNPPSNSAETSSKKWKNGKSKEVYVHPVNIADWSNLDDRVHISPSNSIIDR